MIEKDKELFNYYKDVLSKLFLSQFKASVEDISKLNFKILELQVKLISIKEELLKNKTEFEVDELELSLKELELDIKEKFVGKFNVLKSFV